ncbi:MAG: antitoxin VapB family protein [Methanobacteriota archaeon]
MPTRTIAVSEDAYQGLLAMKRPGESFTDVIRRLTRRRSLTDLSGVMGKDGAEAVAKAIEENRRDRAKRRREELGLR